MYNVDKALYSVTSNDKLTEWAKTPFRIGDNVYATNMHIIVKCPIDKCGDFDYLEESKKNGVLGLFNVKKDSVLTISVSSLTKILTKKHMVWEYEETDVIGNCNECYGEGEVEWEYESWTRDMECPVCDGNGTIVKEKRTKKGEKVFDSKKYIDVINSRFALPLIEKLRVIAIDVDCKKIEVVNQSRGTIFKVGFLEVIVMPVVNTDQKNIIHTFN